MLLLLPDFGVLFNSEPLFVRIKAYFSTIELSLYEIPFQIVSVWVIESRLTLIALDTCLSEKWLPVFKLIIIFILNLEPITALSEQLPEYLSNE